MPLPGPGAQQLAVYIGWLPHGIRGGSRRRLFLRDPSMALPFALSHIDAVCATVGWVAAVFGGLKPPVMAIV